MEPNPYESPQHVGNKPERDVPTKRVSLPGLVIAFIAVIGFLAFIALWDLAAMVIFSGWPKK